MNFASNKKFFSAATTYIMSKRRRRKAVKRNTNTGCEISALMKLTANVI